MMDQTLLVAIVTGLCTAIPCIISTCVSNNTREALQTERLSNMAVKIDDLNKKVDRLADFDKRISLLEQELEDLNKRMEGARNE